MKRYALVKNGAVENVVLWDGVSKWTPPLGYELLPEAEALKQNLPRAVFAVEKSDIDILKEDVAALKRR